MDVLSGIRKFTDTLTGSHIHPIIPNWRVIGSSIRGFSHIRLDLPNQDAIKYLPDKGTGARIILSIADGHGSKNYFRSDIGSKFAVETACEVCAGFLKDYSGKESEKIKDLKFRDVICREIVRKWKERVNDHILNNPFSPEEEILISKKQENGKKPDGEKIRYRPSDGLEDYQVIPYGTTILSIVVTEKFILYLQLGDGDILAITSDGKVSRPLPKDDRLIANETTSLCLPIAWEEFRVRYQPIDKVAPILIMVSSDGYSNSFSISSDFEKVGSDILEMISKDPEDIEKEIGTVKENLDSWLKETSEHGSGDDITVGIICNLDKIREFSKNKPRIDETKKTSNEVKNLAGDPDSPKDTQAIEWVT